MNAVLDAPRDVADQPANPDIVLQFSSTRAAIAKALVQAQSEIGKILLSETANIVGNDGKAKYSYKYADLSGVLAAIRPPLSKAGIAILQAPETRAKSVKLETMFLHESGEWVRSVIDMDTMQATPQGLGSTITYARRYALLAMSGVAPEDDDGKEGSTKAPMIQADPRPILDGLQRLVELIGTRQIAGSVIADSWQELVEGQSITTDAGGDLEALRALYGVLRRRAIATKDSSVAAAPAANAVQTRGEQTETEAMHTEPDGSAEDAPAETTAADVAQTVSAEPIVSEMHAWVQQKLKDSQIADDDALVLEIVAEVSAQLCDRTTYSWANLPDKALREFYRRLTERRKQTAGAA